MTHTYLLQEILTHTHIGAVRLTWPQPGVRVSARWAMRAQSGTQFGAQAGAQSRRDPGRYPGRAHAICVSSILFSS